MTQPNSSPDKTVEQGSSKEKKGRNLSLGELKNIAIQAKDKLRAAGQGLAQQIKEMRMTDEQRTQLERARREQQKLADKKDAEVASRQILADAIDRFQSTPEVQYKKDQDGTELYEYTVPAGQNPEPAFPIKVYLEIRPTTTGKDSKILLRKYDSSLAAVKNYADERVFESKNDDIYWKADIDPKQNLASQLTGSLNSAVSLQGAETRKQSMLGVGSPALNFAAFHSEDRQQLQDHYARIMSILPKAQPENN